MEDKSETHKKCEKESGHYFSTKEESLPA